MKLIQLQCVFFYENFFESNFTSKIKNSKPRCQHLKMVLAHFSHAQIFYPLQEWLQNALKLRYRVKN